MNHPLTATFPPRSASRRSPDVTAVLTANAATTFRAAITHAARKTKRTPVDRILPARWRSNCCCRFWRPSPVCALSPAAAKTVPPEPRRTARRAASWRPRGPGSEFQEQYPPVLAWPYAAWSSPSDPFATTVPSLMITACEHSFVTWSIRCVEKSTVVPSFDSSSIRS